MYNFYVNIYYKLLISITDEQNLNKFKLHSYCSSCEQY